jgi:hypothetical protein
MEELTGRSIINYQSQVMFDPDLVVEMFVFDSEGQLRRDRSDRRRADRGFRARAGDRPLAEFAKRMMGLEPTTFCMASEVRSCGRLRPFRVSALGRGFCW